MGQINQNYQYSNLGYVNPWSNYLAEYQRNIISLQAMSQQNQLQQQSDYFNYENNYKRSNSVNIPVYKGEYKKRSE